jgi:DNA (cytosine-5-)-methyltransferase
MNHASLFSGIGGAELAAAWMGWQNLFHCEISEFPRRVLEYWFPYSVSYEDITTTDFSSWRGKVDILTGGFPCQPFSMAGKRLGAEDDRYLWPHMLRAIREIQPTWVVGENVVGLTTMVQPGEEVEVGGQASLFEENYRTREEQTYTIEEICQGLEQAGYSVQPFVVPACAVGAPHRRDRVWIVAHRADAGVEDLRKRQVDTDEPRAAANTALRGSVAQQTDNPAKRERRKDNGQQSQRREPSKRADGLLGISFPIAHPDSNGQQDWNANGEQNIQSGHGFKTLCCKTSWTDFPTQSPICGRDDGLSLGLVDITFPKWRAESVKALGNAIVPQVIYEIFKAIEEHGR